MSGDLKDPSRSIPLGELAGLAACAATMLLFILILGATCTRFALFSDPMIANKVSWLGVPFLSGLYISSLSSILGSLYSAPRIIQSIASEGAVPPIRKLEIGRGPNKVPVYATFLIVFITCVLIMVGSLNILAILSTLPYLLTYAFVNYAYVALAMTYDLQSQRDAKFPTQPETYGSMHKIAGAEEGDLDKLFPERQKFPPTVQPAPDDPNSLEKPNIIHQPSSWYSFLCNRWVAAVGTVINIVLMICVHWQFALVHILVFLALYFYIGRASQGLFPGISEFSVPHCIKTIFGKPGKSPAEEQLVVAPLHPGVETLASRLNEENLDYEQRPQYHHQQQQKLDDFD